MTLRTEYRTEHYNYGITRRTLVPVDSDSDDAVIEPVTRADINRAAAVCCIPCVFAYNNPLNSTEQKVQFIIATTVIGAQGGGFVGFFAGLPAGGVGCVPGAAIGAGIGALSGLTIGSMIVAVRECCRHGI